MKMFSVITGIVISALLWSAPSALAAGPSTSVSSSSSSSSSAPSVYARLKLIAEKEQLNDVEPDIAQFVKLLIKEQYNVTLTEEEISLAAKNPPAYLGRCGNSGTHTLPCETIQAEVARIVAREERVRKLGRELYLSAGSYELPLSEHLSKFAALSPILGSLLTIWQSGSDNALIPSIFVRMTAAPLPEPQSTTQQKYDDLKGALSDLTEGEGTKEDLSDLAAVVARYRYGYRSIRATEGSCGASGTGGELGLLGQRWCNVEDEINDIWVHLKDSLLTQPDEVGRDEVVLFPTWIYKDLNVVVWVTNRDAGLDWEVPMEPPLPRMVDDRDYQMCMDTVGDESMCSATYPPVAIPGGASLPPPGAAGLGTGICNMPVGASGFLCRVLEQAECRISDDSTLPAGIRLGECKEPVMRTPVRMTPSGPDVCGIGGWRIATENPVQPDTPVQDNVPPTQCSHCSIDLYCSSSCPGGGAFTDARQANGVIPICIPETNQGSTAVLQSLILHELVHAQQKCSTPLDVSTLSWCCSTEYQAYLMQCNALFSDGVLQDVQIQHLGKDLPITPEFCAATLSTLSCGTLGQCSDSPVNPSQLYTKIIEAVERSKTRLGLPTSCADAINKLDPRAQAMIASLPSVCTPECRSEFDNTIGNNLCFIGQCVEQSWEEERLIPGRMSQNVGDEAFPWDSCIGTEPAANTDPPSAGRFVLPTLAFPSLPEYNPWAIAQTADRALCQLLGLPPRTPPTLCMGEVSVQLGRPLGDPLEMLVNLNNAVDAQIDPARDLERMAPSVGTRYATNLYRAQISPLQRSFSEIFDAAAALLEKISSTSFPQQMCSRVDRACPFIPSTSGP